MNRACDGSGKQDKGPALGELTGSIIDFGENGSKHINKQEFQKVLEVKEIDPTYGIEKDRYGGGRRSGEGAAGYLDKVTRMALTFEP